MYKIEFIEGESYARVNGELATDEWWEKETGAPEYDFVFDKDFISSEDALYVKDFNVGIVLRAIATYHEPLEGYDMSVSRGNGLMAYYRERSILGTQGAYVIQGGGTGRVNYLLSLFLNSRKISLNLIKRNTQNLTLHSILFLKRFKIKRSCILIS